MKKKIHPEYYDNAKIICACGNITETGSSVEEMKVDICNACHPFYTGKKKSLDTTGRVDRFKKLSEKSKAKKVVTKKEPRIAKNKK